MDYKYEKDERMGWYTHMFRIDGMTIVGITSETPIEAVNRFKALCIKHERELKALLVAEEKALE